MKLYSSQINELIKKIKSNNVKGLLLYGPDKGYIAEIYELLIKELDFLPCSVSTTTSAQELEIILNSKNFFQKRELIKLSPPPSPFNQNLKSILKTDFFNFLLIIGDEVAASAEVRKFFETGNHLASIACYHDDEQSVVKLVLKRIHAENKTITNDALDFLKINLKGDHGVITSELTKLILFTNDATQITIDDVTKVISLEAISSFDEMSNYFASKDLESFLNEIAKLKLQNNNEVIIIRSLIKYFLNLYIVLSRNEMGVDVRTAVKSLYPPIFFKYEASFIAGAKRFRLTEVINVISILQEAEVEFKLNPHSFDFTQNIYLRAYPT